MYSDDNVALFDDVMGRLIEELDHSVRSEFVTQLAEIPTHRRMSFARWHWTIQSEIAGLFCLNPNGSTKTFWWKSADKGQDHGLRSRVVARSINP
jgi:hypothetical protein